MRFKLSLQIPFAKRAVPNVLIVRYVSKRIWTIKRSWPWWRCD